MTEAAATGSTVIDPQQEELQVRLLTSRSELMSCAGLWNQLWENSNAAPADRAELIAAWVEQFVPQARFRALVVCSPDGAFRGALPLVEMRLPGGVRVGTAPNNFHVQRNGLLLDTRPDFRRVARLLAASLRRLPWPALWLRLVAYDDRPWRDFREACRDEGRVELTCRTHSVGVIRFPERWDDYQAALSGNHRRHMRKADRRAQREGNVELRVERPHDPAEVASLLRAGFGVEDRSWKGRIGSSVIHDPRLFQYFLREATDLAAADLLQLVFLLRDGEPIAFEYGCLNRNTYYTPKVGYDEQHAQLSPSQLLRSRLYKRFYQEGVPPRVDFAGPLSDATSRWATEAYPVGHLFVSVRGYTAPLIGLAFRIWCGRKRFRSGSREEPQCGIHLSSSGGKQAPEAFRPE